MCIPTLLEIRRGRCLPGTHVEVLVETCEPKLPWLALAKQRRREAARWGRRVKREREHSITYLTDNIHADQSPLVNRGMSAAGDESAVEGGYGVHALDIEQAPGVGDNAQEHGAGRVAAGTRRCQLGFASAVPIFDVQNRVRGQLPRLGEPAPQGARQDA